MLIKPSIKKWYGKLSLSRKWVEKHVCTFPLLLAQSIVGNSFGRKLQYINLETEEYNKKKKYCVHINTGIKFSGAAFKY